MSKQYGLSLPPDLVAAVDRWRLSMPVPPSRSAALGALIVAGMRSLAPEYLGGGSARPDPVPPLLVTMNGGAGV